MIRPLFVALLLGLVALPASWYGPAHPWTLVLAAGLLWPLVGILRKSFRAAVWACLVSLAPFIHGVAEAFANPAARGLALIETGLSVATWVLLTAWAVTHRQARLSGSAGPATGAASPPPRDRA